MRINGEKIRELRKKRGLTIVELGKRVGYSVYKKGNKGYEQCPSMQYLETGRQKMTAADKLAKIAFELNVMSEDLLIAEPGDYE